MIGVTFFREFFSLRSFSLVIMKFFEQKPVRGRESLAKRRKERERVGMTD
jgi:hypothetical protein